MTKTSIPVKEIQIPLYNGHLAAKEWGSPTGNPVIALHGWQDNAGSFDVLIPLLSPNLCVVAVDLIGHGLSSHKPIGTQYMNMEFIYHVKCVADYLKWEKFSILGHSMGNALGIMFACIYPHMVDKVVGIDLIKPVTYPLDIISEYTRKNIERYVSTEEKLKEPPPEYSEEEALERMVDGTYEALTKESAKILMKRGVKQIKNGKVIFTRDIRLKSLWDSGLVCENVLKGIVSNINCDYLFFKASNSPTFSDDESLEAIVDIYKKKCKSFEYVEVEGSHFVHLNNPERLAPTINSFLLKKQSSM